LAGFGPECVVTTHSSRRVTFQRRRHNQPVNTEALEELETLGRTKHERGGRHRVCQHRVRRDDRDAGDSIGEVAVSRIENVMPGPALSADRRRPLVIA